MNLIGFYNLKKMGQLAEKDSRPRLPNQIQIQNVKPVSKKRPLLICPYLQFEMAQKIFFIQNEEQIEILFKFGPHHTVHLQLKKQKSKKIPGIYLNLADEYVYAYKHRKLDRLNNIKPEKIFFKKRMYVNQSQLSSVSQKSKQKEIPKYKKLRDILIRKFAQLKLLSLLSLGPRLGRVYNGCDGIITEQYIEYYSQVTINKIQTCILQKSQHQKLYKKLTEMGIYSDDIIKIENLSYSKQKRSFVFKQLHYFQPDLVLQNRKSIENKSIPFLQKAFQVQVTRSIMDLDNQAKMLPYINNLIFQYDFQKAVSKFQESLPMIQDQDQKIQFAQQISNMIFKQSNSGGKQYQKRIQKIVSNSIIKQNSRQSIGSVTTSRNNSKISNKPNSNQVLMSPQKLQNQFQDNNFLSPISQDGLNLDEGQKNQRKQSTIPKQQAQSIIQPLQNINEIKQKQVSQNQKDKQYQRQKKEQFIDLCKNLKNYVLDKNNKKTYQTLNQLQNLCIKSNIQIHIMFGKLLIQSARSRHALTIFQRMLHFSNQVPFSQIHNYYEVALLAGILYFHRYSFKKALKAFEKALSILVRLRHYSIKMMTIHNNIAVIYHIQKNYEQSLFHLHRGFRLGQYSVDFQYLMRSNMAMSLAQKGRIQDAKKQMRKINKIVQPINNMVIFCKFYSNLAYLQLLDPGDGKLDKALSSFQQACNIQQKYLIPNGYKPSIFLHNNIAMLYYKRRQFKKAKFHSEKIIDELNDVDGLVAVKVHFNIGKIFSQGYNYDLPLKHFHQAKVLLSKLDQNKQQSLKSYKQIINKEIQELQKMRIDQVSEEQSYKFSYMSSSLLKKM